MRVIFVQSSNLGGLLIRAAEGGSATHCGLVDGDHVIDATFWLGVARRPMAEFQHKRKVIADIRVPTINDDAVLDFAREQVGKPYDWTGVLGFLAWRDLSSDRSWYCSELCYAAGARAGLLLRDRPRRVGVRLYLEFMAAKVTALASGGSAGQDAPL